MKVSTMNGQEPRSAGLYRQGYLYLLTLLLLLVSMVPQVRAQTITIGKGTGVLWEGLPFNETVTGPMDNPYLFPDKSMVSISPFYNSCGYASGLTNIGGYMALPITQGVGLIPRATASASYTLYDGNTETLSGTIGLPKTEGTTFGPSGSVTVTTPPRFAWCLPPRMEQVQYFYRYYAARSATASGTWVLVADGTQVNSEISLNSMCLGSFSASGSGNRTISILPENITLRISTLECTVSTPTMINFGNVERLTQARKELATYSTSIVTACSQDANHINANINLQFRAISGFYLSQPKYLALAQGGGYITGEIDGVTGSGVCNETSGLPFDNTPLKIGNILATETTKVISNQVTCVYARVVRPYRWVM